MCWIPCALGFRAYLLVRWEEGAFWGAAFSGFPTLFFPLFINVIGACLSDAVVNGIIIFFTSFKFL